MTGFILVVTTTERREDAEKIANSLVERRLAACAQVSGPIHSTYWWEGRVQQSEEWQCLAKTPCTHYDQVAHAIRELHPYEVPAIVATRIEAGDPTYLEWLAREVCE